MDNDEMEVVFAEIQASLNTDIVNLQWVKKKLLELAGKRDINDNLADAVSIVSAQIGALEWKMQSNQQAHDNPEIPPDESASSNFDVAFPPPKRYD